MFEDMSLILIVSGIYLLAGAIKGLLGLGLPTTAITFMTFVMSPLQAIAVNLLPMFLTNVWQFSRAENRRLLVKHYRYFATSLCISIFCFSFFTGRLSPTALQLLVAFAVMLFSIYNLRQKAISLASDKDMLWQILFGCAAGFMGAFTSMWAVPMVIYLLSRNLSPKEFVDAAGFLLLIGCLPLSVGYIATGVVTSDIWVPAIAATISAWCGFQLGEYLRLYVNASLFRRLLLWFFFIMGVRMALVAIEAL